MLIVSHLWWISVSLASLLTFMVCNKTKPLSWTPATATATTIPTTQRSLEKSFAGQSIKTPSMCLPSMKLFPVEQNYHIDNWELLTVRLTHWLVVPKHHFEVFTIPYLGWVHTKFPQTTHHGTHFLSVHVQLFPWSGETIKCSHIPFILTISVLYSPFPSCLLLQTSPSFSGSIINRFINDSVTQSLRLPATYWLF